MNEIRLMLPLLAAGLLAACAEAPEERLKRAETAFAAHRFEDARSELSAILEDDSKNAAAMEALLRTFVALDDPVAANGMLDRMSRLGKQPSDVAVLRGQIDLMSDKFEAALADVEKVRTAEAYRIKALALNKLGRPEDAREAFLIGSSAPGSKSRLYADHARFLLERGDITNAEQLARKAATTKPVSHDGIIVNAGVALARNQPARALEWFDATLKAYPDSQAGLIGKIGVLAALGKSGDAQRLLSQARERRAGDRDIIYLEALLAADRDDWRESHDKLQAIEKHLSNWPEAEVLFAQTMLRLGQGELARVKLTSLLLRKPGDRNARRLLGETKFSLDDPAGALETLRPLADLPNTTQQELSLIAKAEKQAGVSERTVILANSSAAR